MTRRGYADYRPPRTPWRWVWMRYGQWRTRLTERRKRPDGKDYTGWSARVVELPAPDADVVDRACCPRPAMDVLTRKHSAGRHRDGVTAAAAAGIVIIGWVWLWWRMLLCAPER